MTLKEKQFIFSSMVLDLLLYLYLSDYKWMLGYAKRCSQKIDGFECPIGADDSNHKILLAIDIALFKDGKYLTKTEDYKELGDEWKSLGKMYEVDAVWGGDYDDGNHFSIRHRGRW